MMFRKLCSYKGSEERNKYTILQSLGNGAYGQVYRVIDNQSKKTYAMKVFSAIFHHLKYTLNYTREIVNTQYLSKNYKFYPKIYDIMFIKSLDNKQIQYPQVAVIFEIANYDLRYFIDEILDKQKISYKTVKDIIYNLCYSIYIMHRHKIMHRDLKPENVLVKKINSKDKSEKTKKFQISKSSKKGNCSKKTQQYQIKITDFGLSNYIQTERQNIKYIQYEYNSSNEINKKNNKYNNSQNKKSQKENQRYFQNMGQQTKRYQSKVFDVKSQIIQTRFYRAPEIILYQDYNEKIDIWSLGCIIYEIAQKYHLGKYQLFVNSKGCKLFNEDHDFQENSNQDKHKKFEKSLNGFCNKKINTSQILKDIQNNQVKNQNKNQDKEKLILSKEDTIVQIMKNIGKQKKSSFENIKNKAIKNKLIYLNDKLTDKINVFQMLKKQINDETIIHIIQDCLKLNPYQRYSAEQLLIKYSNYFNVKYVPEIVQVDKKFQQKKLALNNIQNSDTLQRMLINEIRETKKKRSEQIESQKRIY